MPSASRAAPTFPLSSLSAEATAVVLHQSHRCEDNAFDAAMAGSAAQSAERRRAQGDAQRARPPVLAARNGRFRIFGILITANQSGSR